MIYFSFNKPADVFFQFNEERKDFVDKVLAEVDANPDPLNRFPFIYFIDEGAYSVAGLYCK